MTPPDDATQIILDPHVLLASGFVALAVIILLLLLAIINGPARPKGGGRDSNNFPRFPFF